jgi:S-formylglutathione hydrolase FrmB
MLRLSPFPWRVRDRIPIPLPAMIAVYIVLTIVRPVRAQLLNNVSLERVNHRLAGHVVDYTNNHGCDRRIYSPILGMPRDLYVYVPPGYDPANSYSLVLFFHMADVDEHFFLGSKLLTELDDLIACGAIPPMVVACPDGTYEGWNRLNAKHSLYVNGCGGRFEDHIMQEVVPFLMSNFSIRPEREAHALLGTSAGGYGAMGLAIKHRDFFGTIATLAAPLNLRYWTCDDVYFENFNPETFRWNTRYDRNQVVGKFYAGLMKVRARRFLSPVFGEGEAAAARITQTNPADLIVTTNLQPGELAIYVNYPGRDNFNFDAQDESFEWVAAQRGIAVTLVRDPGATHSLPYIRTNSGPALIWLGQHLLPPTVKLNLPSVSAGTLPLKGP